LYPGQEPAYVFRGECGEFPTTTARIARLGDLSQTDTFTVAKISDWVAAHLHEEREDLTWPRACALVQHYGMPSRVVDFSGDLGIAFDFAGKGDSAVGRLGVLPYVPSETGPMFKFFDHPWAERAQRQEAFGVLMDPEINDLKTDRARSRFDMCWFEFDILPEEREWCQQRARRLLQESDDPSAGFARHYITRYVEEFGKLSRSLTDWLLKQIVIAPYCALVDCHEGNEAVVFFRGAECLPAFDRELEIQWSRRYWSDDYEDDSRQRIENFVMPSPGEIFVDGRTYHSN
jgi:FRG domain